MKLGPIPPAPPDLSGQLIAPGQSLNTLTATQAQLMRQAGLAVPVTTLNNGQPANPAVPTASPGPCPKCRDKGWVFVSILDGTTRACPECEDVF